MRISICRLSHGLQTDLRLIWIDFKLSGMHALICDKTWQIPLQPARVGANRFFLQSSFFWTYDNSNITTTMRILTYVQMTVKSSMCLRAGKMWNPADDVCKSGWKGERKRGEGRLAGRYGMQGTYRP